MKKYIFILIFIPIQIYAQTQKSLIVWYDIDLADTTINGLYEKDIPFYLPKTLNFIEETSKNIEKGVYECYYRCSLTKANNTFTYPMLTIDTIVFTEPYPPYDLVIEEYVKPILIEDLQKLRIYELWVTDSLEINHLGYKKTTIAFSFILKSDGRNDDGNKFLSTSSLLTCQNLKVGKQVNPTCDFEPYIFIINNKYLQLLQKKLNFK